MNIIHKLISKVKLKHKLFVVRLLFGNGMGLIYNCKFPNEVIKYINNLETPTALNNCSFGEKESDMAKKKGDEIGIKKPNIGNKFAKGDKVLPKGKKLKVSKPKKVSVKVKKGCK